ncbi:MAG: hypothetical protein J2P57_03840 [Acidimicrobiaceae bacterium]|nr:hypothetical protein [Acidimicrobiaceae bacterium]
MIRNERREVLLIGGVNLEDAEEVLQLAADTLGNLLRRVPDGETGPARSQWIQCQKPFFMQHPQLEMVEEDPDRPGQFRQPRVPARGIYARTAGEMYGGRARLREGVSPAELHFENIGYADWAIESYGLLRRLKHAGKVPASWRLQVSLPTPRIPLTGRVAQPDQVHLMEPPYRDAFRREIQRMAAEIPPEELSIQWDCTHPLEYEQAEDDAGRQAIIDYMARLAPLVPDGVELGYHLCYGDFEHRHAWDPNDLGTSVAIANGLAASIERRLDWVHMPVPRARDDVAYFEPLRDLAIPDETTLVLGLVHYTDGVEGTRRRMTAATAVRREFAISCECGMARRPRDTIEPLFRIHAQAAEVATAPSGE